MFTGIIESIGKIIKIDKNKNNINFTIYSNLNQKLKINQSIAHNGVCLSIIAINENNYKVTAIKETLEKTNLKNLQLNSLINLERSLKINDRLNGHIVEGHVDDTGIIQSIEYQNGSYLLKILKKNKKFITIQKGSIAVNGISLTIVENNTIFFTIAITPYTWINTNLYQSNIHDQVNLEFDVFGKYIQELYQRRII